MSDEPSMDLRRLTLEMQIANRKLDDLLSRVGTLERDLAAVKSDVAMVNARIDRMDRRVDQVEDAQWEKQ